MKHMPVTVTNGKMIVEVKALECE